VRVGWRTLGRPIPFGRKLSELLVPKERPRRLAEAEEAVLAEWSNTGCPPQRGRVVRARPSIWSPPRNLIIRYPILGASAYHLFGALLASLAERIR